MEIQLIRNATLRITCSDSLFIIDPYLAPKHSLPSYAGKSPNPLVDLPCSPQEVIDGIEMALISHLHTDHFDPAAQNLLSKSLPIFCQPGNEEYIQGKGFQLVTPIKDSMKWQNITITRTEGQHGTGSVLADMGQVSGFIFQAANEPTVYWAGDTIWYQAVKEAIEKFQPDIIVTHSCGAVWGDNVLIVMDAGQTAELCHAAPNSKVIAVHMEALDHATVSRQSLRTYAETAGITPDQLLIPSDGEKLSL